jgi:rhodanese-related sulfurtransferase
MLIDKGYTKVRPLAGGLDAWIDAGFPVEDAA